MNTNTYLMIKAACYEQLLKEAAKVDSKKKYDALMAKKNPNYGKAGPQRQKGPAGNVYPPVGSGKDNPIHQEFVVPAGATKADPNNTVPYGPNLPDIAGIMADRDRAQSENDYLNKELHNWENLGGHLLEGRKNTGIRLYTENLDLQKQLKALQGKYGDQEAAFNALQGKFDSLGADKDAIQQRFDELTAKYGDQEKAMAELNYELTRQKDRNKWQAGMYKDLNDKFTAANNELASANSRIGELDKLNNANASRVIGNADIARSLAGKGLTASRYAGAGIGAAAGGGLGYAGSNWLSKRLGLQGPNASRRARLADIALRTAGTAGGAAAGGYGGYRLGDYLGNRYFNADGVQDVAR